MILRALSPRRQTLYPIELRACDYYHSTLPTQRARFLYTIVVFKMFVSIGRIIAICWLDKELARQLNRNHNRETHFAAEWSTICMVMKSVPRRAGRDTVLRKAALHAAGFGPNRGGYVSVFVIGCLGKAGFRDA
jgi:hypothetical protein